MARGPKRKPNAIAIADGTLRKDRHGDEIAIVQPCSVPSWLTDPMAIACFTRLQELLGPLGLLKATDVDIVARYCRAHADFRQAIDETNLQGRTVATGQGGLKNHPAWARQKEAAADVLQWKTVRALATFIPRRNPSTSCGGVSSRLKNRTQF